MTRAGEEQAEPATDLLGFADLQARAPQGAPFLPPPRSGPPPMGPMIGPPSGPARRSPLLNSQGRPAQQHPSGEQPPFDGESVAMKVHLATGLRRARKAVATPAGRWSLIGVLALVQVFLLFSTVMWWASGSRATATASVAPMTWTGIVYDVGAAGVYLRSATQVDPANARDTAARGSRLAVSCGQTGDEVAKGTVHTATWLKTTDGLFVSMLYVRVPDRQSIPSCADSTVDAPLLALSDPTNPDLPPPPGTSLGGSTDTKAAGSPSIPARPRTTTAPGAVAAPVPAGAAPVAPGSAVAPSAQAPAVAVPPATIGNGTGQATMTPRPDSSDSTRVPQQTSAPDPDTTPVG
ncbi:hypothetical protein [Actinomycetospora termitidis]|uniref:Uncharacterized protein n=1 Tax=Actinomycetospora termitidis TaxID=3053470 RepID=A0ABT7MEE3_9PSEU|nr:hypothetical protein [Actinomycetospora sp. Odt1-22]MDL5159033.1 hypothetical protein [Actinomycetospora sp. Odt1-22]